MEEEIEKFIIEVTSSDEDTHFAFECTDYSDTDTDEDADCLSVICKTSLAYHGHQLM